jgi:S-methylmethionine-dependent homocysteine/selenocysteine methylase
VFKAGRQFLNAVDWRLVLTAFLASSAPSGVDAILFNCSEPEVMSKAVDAAAAIFKRGGNELRIGANANAFEGESAANEGLHATRQDLNDDAYSRFACSWVDAGETMVDGCCGVGAGHIHRLKKALLRSQGT